MAKRMLVDATHPEETRVVVVHGNRLEEFDFETASRKQLKGNIYLAKVTRVEPSLQAAFIEYGGNRHGFLAFSEIHPDYYRIPVDDRQQLLASEEETLRRAEEADDAESSESGDGALENPLRDPRDDDDDEFLTAESAQDEGTGESGNGAQKAEEPRADATEELEDGEAENGDSDDRDGARKGSVETVGGDGVDEARERRLARIRRSYKIQEVIKRRQIMLVQVTKEERGNKGAALTTYLSLAGRYCVLMPNTPRGGGISRKIANPKDRKRMKAILDQLDLPEGMAVILRTAGLERTKTEIKRDLDYLLRLWDSIRQTTLESTAPTLIHEEANLIKRAIRDLYSKDIDEIDVAGDDGYRTAKDFMRMLVPSHARKVKPYRDEAIPLLQRYQIESQIDAMHSPTVQLKSGGYIVINPTEALVAIDVNSGRATRERNIEETAYRTNLEAAEEVARQLRLRDLAGLIVIDFIDMEQDRHNNAVERKLKDALRQDRARIQVGRISHFGLLEMSRQRLRPSLVETNFDICPRCDGAGLIRSIGSASLHILRMIEEEGLRQRAAEITVTVPTEIALYLLNEKRDALVEVEQRYGFRVLLRGDDSLIAPAHRLQTTRARGEADDAQRPAIDVEQIRFDVDEAGPAVAEKAEAEADEQQPKRKRRSRRGRRRRSDAPRADEAVAAGDEPALPADGSVQEAAEAASEDDDVPVDAAADDFQAEGEQRKKRRRGRRGGRRRSSGSDVAAEASAETEVNAGPVAASANGEGAPVEDSASAPEDMTAELPDSAETKAAEPDEAPAAEADTADDETPTEKPKRKRAARSRAAGEKPKRRTSRRTAKDDGKSIKADAEPAKSEEDDAGESPDQMPADAPVHEPEPIGLAASSGPEPEPATRRRNGPAQSEDPGGTVQEIVNEPPETPRRGWWRRVLDS